MHAISSYHGKRHTHTATNPQIGPITIHCAAKLSVQCKNNALIQLSLSLHFYLLHLPLNSSNGNDVILHNRLFSELPTVYCRKHVMLCVISFAAV